MKTKKTKRKSAIAKSKAKPEIFVRIAGKYDWNSLVYAKAHLRVKTGGYQYLEWKEGGRPHSIYLGKKR